MLLYAAGGALIAALPPGSAFGWTLSIWMFFLVQALYFVVFDITTIAAEEKIALEIDPFERASRRAADILSAGGKLYPN